MMKKDKKPLKQQLDHELNHLQFFKHEDVLKQTHPETWRQKAGQLWNKEISIPLLPISAICIVLFLLFGYKEIILPEMDNASDEKVLIEVSGNMYWKDDFERAMIEHED